MAREVAQAWDNMRQQRASHDEIRLIAFELERVSRLDAEIVSANRKLTLVQSVIEQLQKRLA